MIRIATDVGGTFTDLVAVDEESGRVIQGKALTTPADTVDSKPKGLPTATTSCPARSGRAGESCAKGSASKCSTSWAHFHVDLSLRYG